MTLRTSNWHQNMRRFAQEADNAFGELLTIIPMMARANKDPVPDHTRHVVPALTGQFHWDAVEVWKGGGAGQQHDDLPLPVASRRPVAVFDKCKLPYALKQGDFIKRDCTDDLFEVIESRPYGTAQIVYNLRQLGTPNPFN